MEINFEKAFTFVKEDPKWGRKIAIGGLLSAVALLVLCVPFMVLPFTTSVPLYVALLATCSVFAAAIMFALAGYPFIVINNRINNKEEILPCWKEFFRIVFGGIKTAVGHFLFILPVMFFSVVILLSRKLNSCNADYVYRFCADFCAYRAHNNLFIALSVDERGFC